MEKDTGARTDTEDIMEKYGWFKPSGACKTLWPAKQGETKPQYEEPRAELIELPNEIILYLELPGVKREDIKNKRFRRAYRCNCGKSAGKETRRSHNCGMPLLLQACRFFGILRAPGKDKT
jgi:hypothetical protein